MFIPIIAKLITDLPDIAAGALFTSLSEHHYTQMYNDGQYDCEDVFYFHQGVFNKGEVTRYYYKNLREWCNFFDYSDLTFKPFDKVKIFNHRDI